MKRILTMMFVVVFIFSTSVLAKKKKTEEEKPDEVMASSQFSGLKLRSIGPALTSGRIADFAVDPANRAHYYAAVCSGGVWETLNAGTTWKPIFDGQGSYSIGCIAMDPTDAKTLWVGSGENNSQRSVSYGDGIYLSRDGGASWQNMGLKDSEHIGKIIIHPEHPEIVFVAAQGPLWREGGDRGLYRTKDMGTTWEKVLEISKHTGVNEVMMDPRNPDILYASSYQRRRHVWTLINGGPESTIYKSIDGGDTWFVQEKGLPKVDKGRIGLAYAPSNPDILYAIVEAAEGKSGFFCSSNGGASWEKRSSYLSSSPQYYQEIYVDPLDDQIIYSLDTYLHRSTDGGKNFAAIGKGSKHVDNHAIWIDPKATDYILIGCDGGIYESFDGAKNWKFMANLPVTQFYRITADNSFPFYFVYGGTQDNFSLGAPSRTTTVSGITNADWFVTLGGDGYKSQIDPKDPNIIYAQYQYGGLARFDKKSGERVYIQPKPSLDGPVLKWNWNTPLIISPHNHKRLYYGANVLYRSDDRGNSWQQISPDLSRQVNRNDLEVMGRVWPIGTVAKNKSTSFYGSLVTLSESELEEGLLYGGTDDGLIQVTEDAGKNWREIESFKGVPKWSFVSCVMASQHESNRVYASFDNHKKGDFKPYIMVSEDRGLTWAPVQGNLPVKGTVYSIAEDHLEPNLLFAGTEFGVFFSSDRGVKWVQLKSGIPNIAVRDLSIQERENDLVVASFGRGIFILDNYSPLRELTEATLGRDAYFCQVKDTWQFITTNPLGYAAQGQQGDAFFTSKNPTYGAVFSYYLKEGFVSKKDKRLKQEKERIKKGENPGYPTWDELEKEKLEKPRKIFFEVRDESKNLVCRIAGSNAKGLHRVAWNLKYPSSSPKTAGNHQDKESKDPFADQTKGHMAIPGTYSVSMFIRDDQTVKQVGDAKTFRIKTLGRTSLPAEDQQALLTFRKSAADLQGALKGLQKILGETQGNVREIQELAFTYPVISASVEGKALELSEKMRVMEQVLTGNKLVASHNEATLLGLASRINFMAYASQGSLSAPTQTQTETFNLIHDRFVALLENMKHIRAELDQLNTELEKSGAPWTSGRVPVWPDMD